MTKKIIMDVDTGSDDAVAIMLAVYSGELDVVGICSVDGSRPVDKATDNTLRILKLVNRTDIPVYPGCSGPMVKDIYKDRLDPMKGKLRPEFPSDEEVHFHIDFDYLPESEAAPMSTPAPVFYVEYLRQAKEPVTIVATAPLTNIGMALRIAPDIVDHIDQIVIMGGGYTINNISPCAESNVFRDPEAAARILASGAKVVWIPCDATHEAYFNAEDCEALEAIGTGPARTAAKLCRQRIHAQHVTQPLKDPEAAAIHDGVALCYVLDPSIITDIRPVHCEIGLRDFSDGQTILDPRYYSEEKNCLFGFHADREKYVSMILKILSRSKEV